MPTENTTTTTTTETTTQEGGTHAGVRLIETDKACAMPRGHRRWVDPDPRDGMSVALGLLGYIGTIALAAGTLSLITAVIA